MKNYFDLTGRVAIVTGCSGGLGVQMAKALANQGAIIVPMARRENKITSVTHQKNSPDPETGTVFLCIKTGPAE